MTEPTAVTFEEGYTRLRAIAERVTSEQVPVAEMCELFAEGKGLQKALTGYHDEQKGRVEAIERGEGVRAFQIVTPAKADEDADPFSARQPNAGQFTASAAASGVSDDDIPF
jgi:hypothetical protein